MKSKIRYTSLHLQFSFVNREQVEKVKEGKGYLGMKPCIKSMISYKIERGKLAVLRMFSRVLK